LEKGASGEDLDDSGGVRGERAGAQRGPGSGRGCGRRGTGVDPMTVGEAVGAVSRQTWSRSGRVARVGEPVAEASAVQEWRRSRSRHARGREMIVARVMI
jgi:hypothetical protein